MNRGFGSSVAVVPIPSLPAVVLSADPGASSGLCLSVPTRGGVLIRSVQLVESDAWKVKREHVREQQEVARVAFRECAQLGLPLLVVRERWSAGGPNATPRIMAGLGASWGSIRAQILAAHPSEPAIVGVLPSRWRKAVLPKGGTKRGRKKGEVDADLAEEIERVVRYSTGKDERVAIALSLAAPLLPECSLALPEWAWTIKRRDGGSWVPRADPSELPPPPKRKKKKESDDECDESKD